MIKIISIILSRPHCKYCVRINFIPKDSILDYQLVTLSYLFFHLLGTTTYNGRLILLHKSEKSFIFICYTAIVPVCEKGSPNKPQKNAESFSRQTIKKHVLTINVPLILKVRDVMVF
jgi:hypothetical protein